ncbi:hypothetical protein PT974_04517 [Cladobotryum mycophilum]|uniref:Uncharacterized protein n=1 Tax=Cladobotryum mycophilum TaxID=491253 RepID=A0ABR0SWF7_9HYPO
MSSDDAVAQAFLSAMAPAPELSEWTFPPGPVMDIYYISLKVVRMQLLGPDITVEALMEHIRHAKVSPGELFYQVFAIKAHDNEYWIQVWGQATFHPLLQYLKGEGSKIGDDKFQVVVKDENEAKCLTLRIPEHKVDPKHFQLYDAAGEAKLQEYQRHMTKFGLYAVKPLAACQHARDGTGACSQGFDVCDSCAQWILGLKKGMFNDLLNRAGRIRWDDEARFCIKHQKGGCGFCHPPVGYGKPGRRYA